MTPAGSYTYLMCDSYEVGMVMEKFSINVDPDGVKKNDLAIFTSPFQPAL